MTDVRIENPLIIQSDRTVLLDVHSSRAGEARDRLAQFAELVKSPEHVHTYRLTPLSIWNACAVGVTGEHMLATLRQFAKYPPPDTIFWQVTGMWWFRTTTRISFEKCYESWGMWYPEDLHNDVPKEKTCDNISNIFHYQCV
jgi:hypothetical protein